MHLIGGVLTDNILGNNYRLNDRFSFADVFKGFDQVDDS
jgi:hypothetical protein